MTTMIRYGGRVVAFVGAKRAYLAPDVEALPDGDETLRIVVLMCQYALEAARSAPPREYRDEDALAFARTALAQLD